MKDKRRTENNNLEFLIGWCVFPDPKDDTWETLGPLSGSDEGTIDWLGNYLWFLGRELRLSSEGMRKSGSLKEKDIISPNDIPLLILFL